MGRLLAMGDIHGNYDKMMSVLDLSKYDPSSDKLILIGDYIDRGSKSDRVVDVVINLVKDGAIALLGNHEDMMLNAILDCKIQDNIDIWIQNGGKSTYDSYKDDNKMLDHIDFFNNLKLWHVEQGFLFVHAGILNNIPIEQQNRDDFLWLREQYFLYFEGEQKIVYGHTPIMFLNQYKKFAKYNINKPVFHNNQYFIDTGAAYGGPLTMIDALTQDFWQSKE